MDKKKIRVAVTLSNAYGIDSAEKPGWPKMSVLGWVISRDTETPGFFGGLRGYPEIEKIIDDSCRNNPRWGWIERAEIHDLPAETNPEKYSRLFIIIKANVLARNPNEGTSWYARDAFVNEENAKKYCSDNESSNLYCWISSTSQVAEK